jgi:hypothetical protein
MEFSAERPLLAPDDPLLQGAAQAGVAPVAPAVVPAGYTAEQMQQIEAARLAQVQAQMTQISPCALAETNNPKLKELQQQLIQLESMPGGMNPGQPERYSPGAWSDRAALDCFREGHDLHTHTRCQGSNSFSGANCQTL